MKRPKTLFPATATEMRRPIRQMLHALPMSRDELHDQCVILDADESLFEPALREARESGLVIRDPQRNDWLRLA
jgi:hypothetical protein